MHPSRPNLNAEARQTLIALYGSFTSYHNHKENNAYVAFAAYFGLMGFALTKTPWPPKIFNSPPTDTIIVYFGIIIIFFSAYFLIRWQLENHRWAAVHTSAIANILIVDLSMRPTKATEDDNLISYRFPEIGSWRRLVHFFYPLRGYYAIETDEIGQVPIFLADRLEGLNRECDNGIFHERIISFVMFILFGFSVARCLWWQTHV